jgi:hypothetical protein
MPTLFVLCGLSFSGKTTLARRIADATGSAIVAYDELYATVERDSAITGLDEWYLIRGVLHEQARAHLAAGRSVVVDNLNEEVVDRAAFRAIADEQGAKRSSCTSTRRSMSSPSGGAGTTASRRVAPRPTRSSRSSCRGSSRRRHPNGGSATPRATTSATGWTSYSGFGRRERLDREHVFV